MVYIKLFIFYSKVFFASCKYHRHLVKLERGDIGYKEFYDRNDGKMPF